MWIERSDNLCYLLTQLLSHGQICKDKDEAEVWLVGLKALITRGTHSKWKLGTINCSTSSDSPRARIRKTSPTVTPFVCAMISINFSFSNDIFFSFPSID